MKAERKRGGRSVWPCSVNQAFPKTSFGLFQVSRSDNIFDKPKKGGKYGCEEDLDDCWGFCGGL